VTEQEVAEQIEAELEKLSVSDVLLHTVTTVASLAYRRLFSADRDLDQVRLAIDSLRSLLPLLEAELPDELEVDFRRALADLQLAYADAVSHLQ
jgi:hypothetical protein